MCTKNRRFILRIAVASSLVSKKMLQSRLSASKQRLKYPSTKHVRILLSEGEGDVQAQLTRKKVLTLFFFFRPKLI